MNNSDARAQFISRREIYENVLPIAVPVDAALVIGDRVYRIAYDGSQDALVLVTDAEWRAGLNKARENATRSSWMG